MGIYIDGLQMPEGCGECPLAEGRVMMGELALICRINGNEYSKSHGVCPLVPVPPHGRLVDADKLTEEIRLFIKENMLSRDDAKELLETIAEAPTIIEEER